MQTFTERSRCHGCHERYGPAVRCAADLSVFKPRHMHAHGHHLYVSYTRAFRHSTIRFIGTRELITLAATPYGHWHMLGHMCTPHFSYPYLCAGHCAHASVTFRLSI